MLLRCHCCPLPHYPLVQTSRRVPRPTALARPVRSNAAPASTTPAAAAATAAAVAATVAATQLVGAAVAHLPFLRRRPTHGRFSSVDYRRTLTRVICAARMDKIHKVHSLHVRLRTLTARAPPYCKCVYTAYTYCSCAT